jgi:hypothetical protein
MATLSRLTASKSRFDATQASSVGGEILEVCQAIPHASQQSPVKGARRVRKRVELPFPVASRLDQLGIAKNG